MHFAAGWSVAQVVVELSRPECRGATVTQVFRTLFDAARLMACDCTRAAILQRVPFPVADPMRPVPTSFGSGCDGTRQTGHYRARERGGLRLI
jgi:hypothetical protein